MLLVIGYGVYRRISYVIYRIIKLPEKLGLERQDAEHTIYITPEVPDAVLFPGQMCIRDRYWDKDKEEIVRGELA